MGINAIAENKIKCFNCKKKKRGIFKVVDEQYYCTQCYNMLGGRIFEYAMEELNLNSNKEHEGDDNAE